MSKIKVKRNIYHNKRSSNCGKIAKKGITDKPKRMIKNGIRKVVLPKDVKTKVFENFRGKNLKVDQNQLNELIRKGIDMNIKENILGFQPLLMLKKRYKELYKIHCEEISKCVKGSWFKEGRYGATFFSPGHF